MGVVGIIRKRSFLNCNSLNKIFIPFSIKLNYGDCSSVAERATVARITGVRFSPFALERSGEDEKETSCFDLAPNKNKMVKKKIKFKYSLTDILEDYAWIIGFGLFVSGLTILFEDYPKSLLISGLIIMIIGVIIKSVRKKSK